MKGFDSAAAVPAVCTFLLDSETVDLGHWRLLIGPQNTVMNEAEEPLKLTTITTDLTAGMDEDEEEEFSGGDGD